jgi:hypothetical protein
MAPDTLHYCVLVHSISLKFAGIYGVKAAKYTNNIQDLLPFSPKGLLCALGHAITTYKHHRNDFVELQRRGMSRDASWDSAAQQYEQLFEWALVRSW